MPSPAWPGVEYWILSLNFGLEQIVEAGRRLLQHGGVINEAEIVVHERDVAACWVLLAAGMASAPRRL